MTPASLAALESHLTGDTPAIVQMSGADARALIRYVRAKEEEAAERALVIEELQQRIAGLEAALPREEREVA